MQTIKVLEAAMGQDMASMIMMVGSMILFTVVFYFMIIAPQRKKEKELKKKLETMRPGDKVVTIGGLVGTVANIKDNEITISTSVANTLVVFEKTAINSIISRDAKNESEDSKK